MNTKKIILTVAAIAFLSVVLSSCDRQSCPTYSQTEVKAVENKG